MFEKEVSKGLALLTDEQVRQINLETLNLSSCEKCVLGQLFGDYYDVYLHEGNLIKLENNTYQQMRNLIKLENNTYQQMLEHGFTSGDSWLWGILTDEWKKQILERREKKAETWRDRPSLLSVIDAGGCPA